MRVAEVSKNPATLAALLVGAALAAAACGGSDERAVAPSVRTTDDRCAEETMLAENSPKAEKAERDAAKITRPNPVQTEATGPETAPPELPSGPPDREAEEEASLARDAEAIAEQIGVDAEEAVRRLRLQRDLFERTAVRACGERARHLRRPLDPSGARVPVRRAVHPRWGGDDTSLRRG